MCMQNKVVEDRSSDVGYEICCCVVVFFFFFFKQKTAYAISACLVGSGMCIRDSNERCPRR